MSQPSRYLSPLRYPGGKARLAPYYARILAAQNLSIDTYCEPYAGGAGAGLRLLVDGHVSRLIINDLNPGVAALWRAIFRDPAPLIERIESTPVDLDVWQKQREIYSNGKNNHALDLAFATFFLNRTNRSGILNARPIGGLNQDGKWPIDARFNKPDLIARIKHLGSYSSQVFVHEERAIALVKRLRRRKSRVLFYVDPPYVVPGEELYMSEHSWSEHQRLQEALSESPHPWILTYDADPRTRALYKNFRCLQFGIAHTAQTQKVGSEYMFFSKGLRVPDTEVIRAKAMWVPASTGNSFAVATSPMA